MTHSNTSIATALPPDGYSRFFVIVKILEEIYRGTDKELSILDVGGCSPYLYQCLVNSGVKFNLTIVDILPRPNGIKAKYIQADIITTKIEKSFDVVISTDVLEHIEPNSKDDFVLACTKLSKDLVIIAAPFETLGVDKAEHVVNDFNKHLFGVGQDWLEEHFKYSKPTISQVSKVLQNEGLKYEDFGTNNLYSWTMSAHVNLIHAKLGLKKSKINSARKNYNELLGQSIEFNGPTYRHFFVIYKNRDIYSGGILKRINTSTNPESYINYTHGVMTALYDRTRELVLDLEAAKVEVYTLEQALENEKVYSQKLHVQLQRSASARVTRNINRVRHPARTAKALARRLTRKST